MRLRSTTHWFVGAFCLALIQGNLVYAQPKSSAPGKPTKPPPKAVHEVPVCARPRELHVNEYTWGYDAKGKLITSNVKEAVQLAGMTSMYVFNLSASMKSVDQLPHPHNNLRCAGDQRPPTPPPGDSTTPAPAPASIQGLLSTPPNKNGELPEPVQRFCIWAQDFQTRETPDGKLAMTFATKLHKAITANEAMDVVAPNDLSIEAAGILFGYFHQKLIAALVYKQVVAPHNVQTKFMEFVGDPQWKLFPLLSNHWVTTFGVGTRETVPTVILKQVVYDKVNKSLSEQMANVKSPAEANDAYHKAYANVSSWLDAIAPYFTAKTAAVATQTGNGATE